LLAQHAAGGADPCTTIVIRGDTIIGSTGRAAFTGDLALEDGPLSAARRAGAEATFVTAAPVFERGEHTGAKPGRLMRRG
jgi:N-acyl-D-aspartate/D-glutamate deacylase